MIGNSEDTPIDQTKEVKNPGRRKFLRDAVGAVIGAGVLLAPEWVKAIFSRNVNFLENGVAQETLTVADVRELLRIKDKETSAVTDPYIEKFIPHIESLFSKFMKNGDVKSFLKLIGDIVADNDMDSSLALELLWIGDVNFSYEEVKISSAQVLVQELEKAGINRDQISKYLLGDRNDQTLLRAISQKVPNSSIYDLPRFFGPLTLTCMDFEPDLLIHQLKEMNTDFFEKFPVFQSISEELMELYRDMELKRVRHSEELERMNHQIISVTDICIVRGNNRNTFIFGEPSFTYDDDHKSMYFGVFFGSMIRHGSEGRYPDADFEGLDFKQFRQEFFNRIGISTDTVDTWFFQNPNAIWRMAVEKQSYEFANNTGRGDFPLISLDIKNQLNLLITNDKYISFAPFSLSMSPEYISAVEYVIDTLGLDTRPPDSHFEQFREPIPIEERMSPKERLEKYKVVRKEYLGACAIYREKVRELENKFVEYERDPNFEAYCVSALIARMDRLGREFLFENEETSGILSNFLEKFNNDYPQIKNKVKKVLFKLLVLQLRDIPDLSALIDRFQSRPTDSYSVYNPEYSSKKFFSILAEVGRNYEDQEIGMAGNAYVVALMSFVEQLHEYIRECGSFSPSDDRSRQLFHDFMVGSMI